MEKARIGLETELGFIVGEGTPMAVAESIEKLKEFYVYEGRPDGPEVWICANYGSNKGLFIRIQDVHVAKNLYRDIGKIIELIEEASKENPARPETG